MSLYTSSICTVRHILHTSLSLSLLYIYSTPEAMAEVTKWVVWANAALDPILFLENDRGQVILASLYRARALSRSLALALALALALSTSLSL